METAVVSTGARDPHRAAWEGGMLMHDRAGSWLDLILAILAFTISMAIAIEMLPPDDNVPDIEQIARLR